MQRDVINNDGEKNEKKKSISSLWENIKSLNIDLRRKGRRGGYRKNFEGIMTKIFSDFYE